MNERPTKKQTELLSFIDGFVKGNGYGPSYREIMRALDYKSVSTVATHVNGLIARGYLEKTDNSARSLAVVRTKSVASEHKLWLEQALRKKHTQSENKDDKRALERVAEVFGITL